MLDALRRLIGDLGADRPTKFDGEDEIRLAVAALLYHAIAVDGFVSPEEATRIRASLQRHFGLDAKATESLVAEGKAADLEAVDLYRFTSVLKRHLDDQGRLEVIQLLWEMVFADGQVDEFEDNVVWRVAELLGVSTRDRVTLKQNAARARQAASNTKQ